MQITKEDNAIDEESLHEELGLLLEDKHESEILFYRFSKKRHGFICALHKENRLILLKMILEVCSYNEGVSNIINVENSESYSDLMVFMLTMMMQQKIIDELNATGKKKDVTLLDFISE
jgi:hypothetical protein